MTTFRNMSIKKTISIISVACLVLSLFCFAGVSVSADDSEIKTYGYFEYYESTDGIAINKYIGEELSDVSIPNTIDDQPVVYIANEAFWYCDELIAVDLPDYLEYIGARAFQGCKNLSVLQIPDSVYEIGDAAFDGCSALTDFTIPAELVYVGNGAFDGTQWIKKFEGNDSVILGGRIFYKYTGSASVVNIPSTIKSISANAFAGNQTITYVNIPESLLFIGPYAFYDCPELKSVCVPDGIYYLGNYSMGFNTVDNAGNTVKNEGFVLYANDDTLGADYAKEWEIERKAAKFNPTPDEMPAEEICVAKDTSSDTSDAPENENTLVALILIIAACVVVIGGLYAYFSIADKKYKAKLEEGKKKNITSKKDKKKNGKKDKQKDKVKDKEKDKSKEKKSKKKNKSE